ncbi:hypothetical protein SETIT_5G108600v2 [Setaria italica]|nr:hypothetical protein SETIT_5G108600v2 [Setaria italica]
MEEWRVLAYRVKSTLVFFVCGTRAADFLWLVNAAVMKLATQAYVLRRIQMGATMLEVSAIPMPPPNGYSPMYLTERARLQFEALRWEHAMAGHIVALYRARHGLLQGDPLWQPWEGHHADAIQWAEGALQRLRNAAASYQAAADAMAMAISLPYRSPAWVAWVSEAQSFMRRTVFEVSTARDMVLLMRNAVILEYVAARMVLNG